METKSCFDKYSKLFPFWGSLSQEEKLTMCKITTSVRYSKGTNIHGANGICTGAILVEKGCVRVYMLSEEGREITLYRLYPGDICMLSASCVIKSITFDVMVDAEEDSDCYIINAKQFSELLEKNVYVNNFALEKVVERFSDVMWVMQQILFMSLDKRLAIFLLDESNKSKDGIVNLTNEQIAKYMGSAREAVSRMMKYFKEEGIAERKQHSIIILDKSKLKKLAL